MGSALLQTAQSLAGKAGGELNAAVGKMNDDATAFDTERAAFYVATHCVGVYAKSGEECEDESDDVYGGVHEIEHIDKSEDGQDEKRCDDNDGGHDKEYDKERSKLYGDASG
ncbi:hypothetical protein PF007_g19910 [Phytophthora fragariae]|uniref:Uncharacterized protein n=1 Tax=Phytophthora fragariae TaxID=53985 RepID=A0A6A3JM44_9STRA|nr:hypothetical protein PF011_g16706 [Phytophthora fragariae]KAE9088616.1 hypothetical protein PF007_g19910 [Phytophthora fragariae]